jgi:acetyl-CoA C-acetyltransferase
MESTGSAHILGGCRTPIGKLSGSLASLTAPQLGGAAIREALRRTGTDPNSVDEVIMGIVLSAGVGQAPARQAALLAGIPERVAALSINKVCGSGLKAVMLADQIIRAGDANCIVAGGMESMSRAPYLAVGARQGWKYGHQQLVDSMLHDGLWCASENCGMGALADELAAREPVSRADQDAYALESHRRAVAAPWRDEIVAVSISARGQQRMVSSDEGPRGQTSADELANLPAAFGAGGSVTAGNAAQISDGAAAVVVGSERMARECQSPIKARIVASVTCGVHPRDVFLSPVLATEQVLARANLRLADIDVVEINEAFAAQSVACTRRLKLDPAKTNVHGGAIALGHPIGASGARLLVTLLHALAAREQRLGLVSLCLGGGHAVAMIIELEGPA